MKISKFNRTNLSEVRQLLSAKLKEFEAETGIAIEIGNIRFSETSFSSKFEAKILGDSSSEDVAKKDFEAMALFYGLRPEMFGKEVILSGKKFKITGIKRGARKNCVLITDPKGKTFVTNPQSINLAFK